MYVVCYLSFSSKLWCHRLLDLWLVNRRMSRCGLACLKQTLVPMGSWCHRSHGYIQHLIWSGDDVTMTSWQSRQVEVWWCSHSLSSGMSCRSEVRGHSSYYGDHQWPLTNNEHFTLLKQFFIVYFFCFISVCWHQVLVSSRSLSVPGNKLILISNWWAPTSGAVRARRDLHHLFLASIQLVAWILTGQWGNSLAAHLLTETPDELRSSWFSSPTNTWPTCSTFLASLISPLLRLLPSGPSPFSRSRVTSSFRRSTCRRSSTASPPGAGAGPVVTDSSKIESWRITAAWGRSQSQNVTHHVII